MKDDGRVLVFGAVALIAAAGMVRQGSAAFDLEAELFGKGSSPHGDWQDNLDNHARAAFELFRADDPRDRAISVAYTVGAEACRTGVSEEDLSRWLQGRYGSLWVRLGNLDPGADLSEVRKALLKAFYKGGK